MSATTIYSDGINLQYENRYKVNWACFTIFLAACLLLFVDAVGGIALKALAPVSDVLGYVSTLTKDNPYVDVPEGGSTLGGIERNLMRKDLKLRLGDVAPENDRVGHIAIASLDRAKRLFVGRLYS